MFLREAAGPRPRSEILQRFWFADSCKRITHDGFDKVESAERNLAIGLNPITKILAKLVLENSDTTFSASARPALLVQTEITAQFRDRLRTAFALRCASQGTKQPFCVPGRPKQMCGLDETSQLVGRDECDIVAATTMDDDDVATVRHLVEKSFEICAGMRVGCFSGHILACTG